ncbi:MAG TPA: alpha/beta hydrolase-fold protein [Bacteroidales bacterium]|nr:alpha/beta hydrolase-fold protein [Bacteroidales bacterium]
MKFLLLGILFSSQILFSQTDNKVFWGEKNVIHSEIFGEDKEYWVHLPENYNEEGDKYPVLYITDGDEHFYLASGLVEFMSAQFMIPEFIVVAIFHQDRNHDLTPTHSETDINGFQSPAAEVSGGGKKLLEFIEKELIENVENRHSASSYRILTGHSLGGLFCTYAYLTRNHLFKGFIAMDPALNWDDHACEQMLRSLPDNPQNLKNKLYIASAHNAPEGKRDKGPFRMSQLSFTKELDKKGVTNYKFEVFEKETHMTVAYQSLYAGLVFLFPDYYIFKDPHYSPEIPYIIDFYNKVSDRYGMEVIPPEQLLHMIGKHYLFETSDYARAIEMFKFNTRIYPNSYKAFEFLAKAYKASGDEANARLYFEKSQQLDPNN